MFVSWCPLFFEKVLGDGLLGTEVFAIVLRVDSGLSRVVRLVSDEAFGMRIPLDFRRKPCFFLLPVLQMVGFTLLFYYCFELASW